jgi:hypothetical protein
MTSTYQIGETEMTTTSIGLGIEEESAQVSSVTGEASWHEKWEADSDSDI